MQYLCGGVVELADAGDLKSLAERLAGSSPAAPTSFSLGIHHTRTRIIHSV